MPKWTVKALEPLAVRTEFSIVHYAHESTFFEYERKGQRAAFDTPQESSEPDVDMLIALATGSDKEFQVISLSPIEGARDVHQYVQVAKLGVLPHLDPTRVGELLLDQFSRFPSFSPTRFSPDGSSAILNLGDHVDLSAVRSWEYGSYSIIFLEARTKSRHALAGQLNHMFLQNIATGESYLVRTGVGHLLGLDTPGAGVLDHVNEFVGGYSWVLASRFASAVIAGDAGEIARLEKRCGLIFGKLVFTGGGIFSRSVVQPIQRITFPRTPETLFAGYLIALLLFLFAFSTLASENDKKDRQAKEGPSLK